VRRQRQMCIRDRHYAFLTKAQLTAMINTKELTEICYDCKN
ncbi:hypothetical protein ACX3VG_04745, partial [Escherichia coli]